MWEKTKDKPIDDILAKGDIVRINDVIGIVVFASMNILSISFEGREWQAIGRIFEEMCDKGRVRAVRIIEHSHLGLKPSFIETIYLN